jgi:hypothetical protein
LQKPASARKAPRKKSLQLPEYGARLLRQAIALLDLTKDEERLLHEIARRNEAAGRGKTCGPKLPDVATPQAPTPEPAAKKGRKNASVKTKDFEELARLERIRAERIQAERERVHKKSKFTTFVLRAPGSYEGGKS